MRFTTELNDAIRSFPLPDSSIHLVVGPSRVLLMSPFYTGRTIRDELASPAQAGLPEQSEGAAAKPSSRGVQ